MLVEEFIAGEEVTVGMVGNSPPRLVGIMRVVPRKKDADFVYSLEVKRDYEKSGGLRMPGPACGKNPPADSKSTV